MAVTKEEALLEFEEHARNELKASASKVLALINQLDTLDANSEAYEDVWGLLYAYALQVELDARYLRKVGDELDDLDG